MGGGDSGGGGTTTQTSTSRPLTGPERAELYAYGANSISGSAPAFAGVANYTTPTFQGLSGGDYDRLEQNIVTSRLAPLQAAYGQQSSKLDSDLARRGIYSSGAATQAQNDLTSSFLPQINAASAEAAAQRYGLQNSELTNRNQFNLENASRNYNTQWKPYEFAQGIWNGTGGAVSSGASSGNTDSGWNFTI
jgi:hypothetical protein